MPLSIVSSLPAPPVISRICSSKRSSCMSKSFCSVNVFGFMSNSTSVTTMRRSQWRGRSASFFRLAMSGSEATKEVMASSADLYGFSSLTSLGSFLRRASNSSMPLSSTVMSSSAQRVSAQRSR